MGGGVGVGDGTGTSALTTLVGPGPGPSSKSSTLTEIVAPLKRIIAGRGNWEAPLGTGFPVPANPPTTPPANFEPLQSTRFSLLVTLSIRCPFLRSAVSARSPAIPFRTPDNREWRYYVSDPLRPPTLVVSSQLFHSLPFVYSSRQLRPPRVLCECLSFWSGSGPRHKSCSR